MLRQLLTLAAGILLAIAAAHPLLLAVNDSASHQVLIVCGIAVRKLATQLAVAVMILLNFACAGGGGEEQALVPTSTPPSPAPSPEPTPGLRVTPTPRAMRMLAPTPLPLVEIVYVKTRQAVLRETSEPGSPVIMELDVPAALKVLGATHSAYQVEIVGWVKDSAVILQDDTLTTLTWQGDGPPPTPAYVWETPLPELERLHFNALGKLTAGSTARFLGESLPGEDQISVTVDFDFLKAQVTGWVNENFVTANFEQAQAPGAIFGTVTREGAPAPGAEVRVSVFGDAALSFITVADNEGRYEFVNLTPGVEYDLYVTKPETGEQYTNLLFPFPVLDPAERLDYGNVELADLD